MEFMERLRPLALLLLRVGVGVVFMDNGYPKFWGRRLEHIDEFVHVAHLPAYFVYIAGALELGGGALLVVGLFTRVLDCYLRAKWRWPCGGTKKSFSTRWPWTRTGSRWFWAWSVRAGNVRSRVHLSGSPVFRQSKIVASREVRRLTARSAPAGVPQ